MLSVQVAAYPKKFRSWPEYRARELFIAGRAPFIRTMIRVIYEIIPLVIYGQKKLNVVKLRKLRLKLIS